MFTYPPPPLTDRLAELALDSLGDVVCGPAEDVEVPVAVLILVLSPLVVTLLEVPSVVGVGSSVKV